MNSRMTFCRSAVLAPIVLAGCAGEPVAVDWDEVALRSRSDWHAHAPQAAGIHETALIVWRTVDPGGRLLVGSDGTARIVREQPDRPTAGR